MKRSELKKLIHLFLTDSITEQELICLHDELKKLSNDDLFEFWDTLNDIPEADIRVHSAPGEIFERLMLDSRIQNEISSKIDIVTPRLVKPLYLIIGSVAALFLFFFSNIFFFKSKSTEQYVSHYIPVDEIILPGGKNAKIIFANGASLDLEKLNVDSLIKLDGYSIVKRADGTIKHIIDSNFDRTKNLINTIVTPKGGEYSLALSDGSIIHLNSDTELSYPVEFIEDNRQVELHGEAYFDVAKKTKNGKNQTFLVKTGQQTVEVLGTIFNIKSYGKKIQTTLVEGSVNIIYGNLGSRLLQPNQQANFVPETGAITVQEVDPFYVINWKNGMFSFDDASIYEVMDAIGRWYNVEYQFVDNLNKKRFSGTMSRAEDINKVLNTIELTGEVHFKRVGRRIIVMK